jgi:catechol 2,3-dioxygenase-like lactoylglutathione lyase family enzyme
MSPLAISHVNFPAEDAEALRRWYEETLEFERHGDFLWSAGTLLNIVPGKPLGRDANWHFGFRVDSVSALRAWVARLREKGVQVDDPSLHGDYASVYVADPEGNTFEIFYERLPADSA